jgi:RHS repeat-associated protein
MRATRFGGVRLAAVRGGSLRHPTGVLAAKTLGCSVALLVAVSVLAPASASAEPLCTDTWTGPAEGSWQTAADWSEGHVPTSTDVACIGSGKTVNVTEGTNQAGVLDDEGTLAISGGSLELASSLEASKAQTLSITGGALTGAAEVDVPGSLTANGGALEGAGKLVIGSKGSATVESGGLTLVGRELLNEGSLTVKGPSGRITGEAGASIVDAGTFTVNGEGSGNGLVAGSKTPTPALTVTSTGTLKKTEGTGTTPAGFTVDNEGAVSATSGTLSFTAGGSSGREHIESWSGQVALAKGSFTLGEKALLPNDGEVELVEGAKVSAGAVEGTEFSGVTAVDGTLELTSATVGTSTNLATDEKGQILVAPGGKIAGKIIKMSGGVLSAGTKAEVTYKEVIIDGGSLSSGAESKLSYTEFIQKHGTASIGAGTSLTGLRYMDVEGSFGVATGCTIETTDVSIGVGGELEIGSASTLTSKEAFVKGLLTGPGTLKTGFFAAYAGSTISGTGTIVANEAYFIGSGKLTLQEHRLVILEFGALAEGTLVMSDGAVLETSGQFEMNSEDPEFGPQIQVAATSTTEPRIINRGEFAKGSGSGTTEVTVPFENWGSAGARSGKLIIGGGIVPPHELQYGEANPSEKEHHRAACGDAVDCVTGNFTESQADFAIGGRGVGLALTRYYNAQAAAAGEHGAFGYGWTSSFSDRLVLDKTSKIATVHQANGSTVPFSEEGASFKAPAWSQDTLTGSAEAGYTLTLADQTKYKFAGSSGRLESVTDRDGNATTLSYGEAGRPEAITDPAGRKIKLSYNSEGLVESAEDPLGHVVKYTYEGGNLKSVTQPAEAGLRWQFKYDGSHEVTEMIDGRSGKTLNEYNSAHQVISQKDPLGHALKWEYEGFQTKITNEATGSVTADDFNSAYGLAAVVHGFGTSSETTERFTYNAAGDMLSKTDGGGHNTEYGYDSANDRTSKVDADKDETKWSYDGTHDVETMTTPNGETTTYKRESHGNPEVIERPAPGGKTQITKYKYTATGELESVEDPLKRLWKYEYDTKGDRTAEVDPLNNKRTWEFNEDSQEVATVSPRGNVTGGKPAEFTTKTERDAQGRPLTVTDPLKHTTKYKYDGDGNLETVTDGNNHATTTTYNADNQAVKVKEANGTVTETEYDGAGQVISQTDGDKRTTKYVRNVLEQVVEVVDPLGRKTTKEYDPAGNLKTLTDPAKRTAKYAYDPANRLTEVSYSSGSPATIKYEYDKDGDRTKMTDGTGTTTYTYDQLDRMTESENGHKEVVKYEYDLAGERTKITYPNAKSVTRAYDKDGRLEKVTDWNAKATKFSYSPDSELTLTTFPTEPKNEDKYVYNDADKMTEVKMLKGSETLASLVYTRDSDGQLKKATSKGLPGAEVTEYAYDTNNRVTKAGASAYEYDAANNPTKIATGTYKYDSASELETGPSLKYAYDELGERTKTTPEAGPATTYGYDQAGNLTSVERPKEGETAEIKDSYAYNGEGLRTSQTVTGATSYLAWDVTESVPLILGDGTNSYVYGPTGLPVEQINNSTGTVLYLHHDQQGSTRLLTGSAGTVTGSLTFDAYGNKTGSTGTSTTPLGYDGQYTSSDTGLIYLRARTYDPATAQFLSVDPAVMETRAPYNYVGDNPLNHGDLTGLSCGLTEPWDCVTEPIEASIHFVEQHPVLLPILGCTVGLLVGPEVCAGSVTAAFVAGSVDNVTAYLSGNLTAEQFANKELETTLISVLSALPGAIADRITSLEGTLKESPAALQLLWHTVLESPDLLALEDQLNKLESEHICSKK